MIALALCSSSASALADDDDSSTAKPAATTTTAVTAAAPAGDQPPRVTFAGEAVGAIPADSGNRALFGMGGGAAAGAEIYVAPLLGIDAGAMLIFLSKNNTGMSSTTWLAGHVGPRLHLGELLFGADTHHDAWVDAHLAYGTSGGIHRPGFDAGAAVQWEVSPALRLGPMLRYQFGSDPRDRNAQLVTLGLAVGFGGRTRTVHVTADRDGDGIADAVDKCPDDPAGEHPDPKRLGCPSTDRDGDGIADAADLCPDEAAGDHPDPARAGCPFKDRDGDKIADADDKCPDQAGPPNPFEPAKNGCPVLARVTQDKIEILQQIFFETDQATIKQESFPVLEAVAGIMKKMSGTRVRVEGHTDDRGTDEYNLDLSKRRARAVAQWLVTNGGIDAPRLETEGYGKSRPLVTGPNVDTSLNRRVEFVLLGDKE